MSLRLLVRGIGTILLKLRVLMATCYSPVCVNDGSISPLTLDEWSPVLYSVPMMTNQAPRTRWDKRLEALDAFVEREGHALVPANYIETSNGSDISLGSWVSYLRTRHKKGALSPERVAKLEAYPGWEWGPLRPGPKPNTSRDEEIRRMRADNKSLQEIGTEFNLSRQRIHQIVST